MDDMPTIPLFADAPIDSAPATAPAGRRRGRPAGSTNKKPAPPADKKPAPPADKPPTERPGAGRPSNKAKRAQALEGLYTMAGGMLLMVSPSIGTSILAQAHDCADALATLAETNRKVARALDAILTSGGTGAVLIAHLPILLATYRVVTAGEPVQSPDAGPLDLLAAMASALG